MIRDRRPVRRVRRNDAGTVPTVHAATTETSDRERRALLFDGDLFAYTPRPSTLALCDFVHKVLFAHLGEDPPTAHLHLSETQFAAALAAAQDELASDPTASRLVGDIVVDLGCDPETTYVGGQTVSAVTSQDYLARGTGERRHPHRDTWYAASASQLNWTIPLYEEESTASIAFHPHYWDRRVTNSSGSFDYRTWARQPPPAGADARGRNQGVHGPRALEIMNLSPEISIACPAGGLIVFSGAQLYSVVPNDTSKTQFSARFCSVNESDLREGRGAVNHDAHASGTTLSSFVSCRDHTPIPGALVWRDLVRRGLARGLRTYGGPR